MNVRLYIYTHNFNKREQVYLHMTLRSMSSAHFTDETIKVKQATSTS